jgi:microsomal dipeptidase-like Zn-dependent dipeptidase
MNRVGIVVDMSHSAEKSTFDAIELSEKANSNHSCQSLHFGMQQKEINLMIF